MAEVFISYKRERRRAAAHLERIVRAHGFTVWYDHMAGAELQVGSAYRKQIERELRAADAVLVLWCALSRESDWVEDEARLAKQLGTYIPVRLAHVDPPLGLGADHFVDLTGWDGAPGSHLLYPLFRAIEQRVGRASDIDRGELERVDSNWRMYGAPRMLTFELVSPQPVRDPAESQTTERIQHAGAALAGPGARQRPAETTLPLEWNEPARSEVPTVRPAPTRAAPPKPAAAKGAGAWGAVLRWTGWALVAALALVVLQWVFVFRTFPW